MNVAKSNKTPIPELFLDGSRIFHGGWYYIANGKIRTGPAVPGGSSRFDDHHKCDFSYEQQDGWYVSEVV